MKHILEFFHDVIPIVFVVGIVALAFIFYNHTKNLASAGIEKSYTFDAQLENADILVYDQMTVSGTDVIRFVKDYYKAAGTSGAFSIVLSTGSSNTTVTSNDVSATVSSNASYICSVTSDSGTITKVTFYKQ